MRYRSQLFIGTVLVVAGLLFLIGELTGIGAWQLCWPTLFIGLGIWLLVRPRFTHAPLDLRIFGDVRRRGSWQVGDEELWMFIGDAKLDLTEAEIPAGESRFRIFAFIGDVDVRLPAGAGVAVSSVGFVTEANLFGEPHTHFLAPLQWESPDYVAAERKVIVEVVAFIVDLDVVR